MKPETVKEVSGHKNIVGIKEATGDLSRVKLIKELCEGLSHTVVRTIKAVNIAV